MQMSKRNFYIFIIELLHKNVNCNRITTSNLYLDIDVCHLGERGENLSPYTELIKILIILKLNLRGSSTNFHTNSA